MTAQSDWSYNDPGILKIDSDYANHYRPSRQPDFKDSIGRLDPEHWDDILMRIDRENRDTIEKEYADYHMFMIPNAVQLIFTICVRLELPHEVRYLALFIFDEYMRVQITRLYDEIALSDDDDLTKIQRWESASLRFYSQSTLRAVTSISVSIKMCYYRLTLSPDLLQRILVALNQMYDETSIIKSEYRVFSTIMFTISINRNPITIMETIECAMFSKCPDLLREIKPGPLWEYAVLFMDLIYLNAENFYSQLWEAIHKKTFDKKGIEATREHTWHLEADFVILSVGVISIAAYCLHGNSMMLKVVESLGEFMRIDSEEINVFVQTIHKFSLENEIQMVPAPTPDFLGMKHVNVDMTEVDFDFMFD